MIPKQSPTSPAERAGDGVPKGIRVAILFYRCGPYHHARLKAAGERMQVTGVEFSNVDRTYAWDMVEGAVGFERVTLFSGAAVEDLPASRISERVNETLEQIRPQVVAIPGWHDHCSLAALQWCGLHRIPAVVMSETTAWDTERSWGKEFLKRRIVELFASALVGGQAHAEYLEQLGMERGRIFFGYDAVDNAYFREKAEKLKAEIKSQKSEVGSQSDAEVSGQLSVVRSQSDLPSSPFFLASARFIGKKNLPRLIESYARYRTLCGHPEVRSHTSEVSSPVVSGPIAPWSLVLLGDGALRSSLEFQVSSLGLQDSVRLPGFKQYQDLPAYYANAGAFVHASTIEPWGLVVNEAMASGLPVLVSNRCGCAADLVREGVNGFTFDPYNVEELAQLMLKISAPNFPLSAFGLASRQIVEVCSPENFGANLQAACELAISKPRLESVFVGHCVITLLSFVPDKVLQTGDEKADTTFISKPVSAPANFTRAGVAPNFFIIGAPKSGTTSLCEYLKDHPNVFFSPVKEPHFFDLDASKPLKLNLRTYLSLFSNATPGVHKAVGEGSTGYLFSKAAVSEILKFNPEARFIVMLRNPVDLVQAWHSEMYFEGVEDVSNFEKAWRLEPERRQGRHIPSPCWEPKKLYYSEWGKLGDQMERLFSAAPRDRIKIIMFDDFVSDTKGVYEAVLAFLGVPSEGRTDFPKVNENKDLRFPWAQRRMAAAANHFRRMRVASGWKLSLGSGLSQKLLILNSKPASRKRISPELQAELLDFFRADVQKLGRLLGRDLSPWISNPATPTQARKPTGDQ